MRIGQGTLDHAQLLGITANNHHNQLHAADHLAAGGDPLSTIIRATVQRKSADQTVNNTITLTSITNLFPSVNANEVWVIRWVLFVSGTATAQLRVAVQAPSGATMHARVSAFHPSGSGTDYWGGNTTTSAAPMVLTGTALFPGIVYLDVSIAVGPNPGTIAAQFAQGVAEVSDCTVLAGSYMIAHRIS